MTVKILKSSKARARKVTMPSSAMRAAGSGAKVFISSGAAARIEEEGIESFNNGKESMGLLYGTPFRYNGRQLVRIEAAVSLPVNSTSHHVSVDRNGYIPEGQTVPDGCIVVGWYHSHTGVGNFMSGTDRATHEKWFRAPYAVSVIFEASDKSMCVYRLVRGESVEVLYSVYDE